MQRHSTEDLDDDNDSVPDVDDDCDTGIIGWSPTPINDYDSDGCRDADEDRMMITTVLKIHQTFAKR